MLSAQMLPYNLPDRIYQLERHDLNDATAPSAALWGQLENVPMIRVLGQAAFWKTEHAVSSYACRMDDLLTSVYGRQEWTFIYTLWYQGDHAQFWYGLVDRSGRTSQQETAQLTLALLRGAYPDATFLPAANLKLGSQLRQAHSVDFIARLSGIPTRKIETADTNHNRAQAADEQIERVLRSISNQEWGITILATPWRYERLTKAVWNCLDEAAAVDSTTRQQFQEVTMEMNDASPGVQVGTNRSSSSEVIDRRAKYLSELLDRQFERLREGQSTGYWDTDIYVFAPVENTLTRLGGLLRGVYGGTKSQPQPVRISWCAAQNSLRAEAFTTPLTSSELGTFIQLPRIEVPGFRITDYALFDTDFTPPPTGIPIGEILAGEHSTRRMFTIERGELCKHALIAGTPGSGKTNSVMRLLNHLWSGGKEQPFLVIEPAKAEYRSLLARIPDLAIYTLGDETVAPIRINPFEFEITDTGAHINLQTHIDYLKALFNAAFILYAPMPYVLDMCVHEIYEDYGWDLSTGQNLKLAGQSGHETGLPIFPTLRDLYLKVDDVVRRLGYDKKIEMDVKAGLKARIQSLQLGSRGLMLDTAHGLPISELLSQPTILELERIGNDDEKAFLIGLLLMRLYEHRILEAKSQGKISADLRHILVIEEAHRLLANISTQVDTESANTRGQAVETFTNMLAEMRAYGQGVIVVEQIPTKLAPDVIKNTALKIIHRLIAADDREIIGQTTNMNEEQVRSLITLTPGLAVAFHESADHPYRIAVEDFKQHLGNLPDDAAVRRAVAHRTARSMYEPEVELYARIPAAQNDLSYRTLLVSTARAIAQHPLFPAAWDALVLAAHRCQEVVPEKLAVLEELILSQAPGLNPTVYHDILVTLILHSSRHSLSQQGNLYHWTYGQIETMRRVLVDGLVSFIASRSVAEIHKFATIARKLTRIEHHRPFVGCALCAAPCVFRFEARRLSLGDEFQREYTRIVTASNDLKNDMLSLVLSTFHEHLGQFPDDLLRGGAFCMIVQVLAERGYSRLQQQQLANVFADALFSE